MVIDASADQTGAGVDAQSNWQVGCAVHKRLGRRSLLEALDLQGNHGSFGVVLCARVGNYRRVVDCSHRHSDGGSVAVICAIKSSIGEGVPSDVINPWDIMQAVRNHGGSAVSGHVYDRVADGI